LPRISPMKQTYNKIITTYMYYTGTAILLPVIQVNDLSDYQVTTLHVYYLKATCLYHDNL